MLVRNPVAAYTAWLLLSGSYPANVDSTSLTKHTGLVEAVGEHLAIPHLLEELIEVSAKDGLR